MDREIIGRRLTGAGQGGKAEIKGWSLSGVIARSCFLPTVFPTIAAPHPITTATFQMMAERLQLTTVHPYFTTDGFQMTTACPRMRTACLRLGTNGGQMTRTGSRFEAANPQTGTASFQMTTADSHYVEEDSQIAPDFFNKAAAIIRITLKISLLSVA